MKTNCFQRGLLVSLCIASLPLSCTTTRSTEASFRDEFDLTVRAGREKLTAEEKRRLLDQNHPLLTQMGNPQTFALVKLLANLPDDSHKELLSSSYLKWKFTELDAPRQKVFRDMVQSTIDAEKQQGGEIQDGMSVAALEQSEVGLAVVDIPPDKQKVVSIFVTFPEALTPLWVTVVNARIAGTVPYFQAHLQRLPMLKAMPTSALPK